MLNNYSRRFVTPAAPALTALRATCHATAFGPVLQEKIAAWADGDSPVTGSQKYVG